MNFVPFSTYLSFSYEGFFYFIYVLNKYTDFARSYNLCFRYFQRLFEYLLLLLIIVKYVVELKLEGKLLKNLIGNSLFNFQYEFFLLKTSKNFHSCIKNKVLRKCYLLEVYIPTHRRYKRFNYSNFKNIHSDNLIPYKNTNFATLCQNARL